MHIFIILSPKKKISPNCNHLFRQTIGKLWSAVIPNGPTLFHEENNVY